MRLRSLAALAVALALGASLASPSRAAYNPAAASTLQGAYTGGASIAISTGAPVALSATLNQFTNVLSVTQPNTGQVGILVSGGISSTTTGTSSERFGNGALVGSTASAANAGQCTAFGNAALGGTGANVIIGDTAFGYQALDNSTNQQSTGCGYQAGITNAGLRLTAVGYQAGTTNTVTGSGCTAVGYQCLQNNNAADQTAVGAGALPSSTGASCSAFGSISFGNAANTGIQNSGFGYATLYMNSSGHDNTAVGYAAGYSPAGTAANANTTGIDNTYLGSGTGANSSAQRTNTTTVGFQALSTADNQVTLGNSSVTQVQGFGSYSVLGAHGENITYGQVTLSVTLSTGGTTTNGPVIPAGAWVTGVVARVTTTITTATSWSVTDNATTNVFIAAQLTLTSGTTAVGLGTTTSNFYAAANTTKVVTVGTPGAGVVRVTVFYALLTAPTS